jgi:hypothetical protein
VRGSEVHAYHLLSLNYPARGGASERISIFRITPVPEPNTVSIAMDMSICWMSFHQSRCHKKQTR